ncbi:hypothetical protein AB6A40_002819 [Gnathostoma spinigerum]|uniref:WD repeat-containing protein 79 n=1 Tax=Gnathostoma spinigerum TaxID=75299 RepID=A0ABD6EII4_9BILA
MEVDSKAEEKRKSVYIADYYSIRCCHVPEVQPLCDRHVDGILSKNSEESFAQADAHLKVEGDNSSTLPSEKMMEDTRMVVDVSALETREERQQNKAARTGMAYLLQQLRSGCADTSEVDGENPKTVSESKRTTMKRSAEVTNEEFNKKVRISVNYNFSNPTLVFTETNAFANAVATFGFSLNSEMNNYIKCCKWSFDGGFIATSSQDRNLRIFALREDRLSLELGPVVALGDLIYDVCWHPSALFVAATSKDHPIHIWNAEGQRIHSCRGINHLDELTSAFSLCFSLDGHRLYGGYKSSIRIFDLNASHQKPTEVPTWTKACGGQKGIISCIAMSPAMQGVYAAACYGKQVGLYSNLSPSVECVFETPSSAVTHMAYSADGNRLFTGGRNDESIHCWDLRYPGVIVSSLQRPNTTNQRVYFQIDSSSRFIISGSTAGDLYVFELSPAAKQIVQPSYKIKAHQSALTGVSLHPDLPLIATCSGQRIFPSVLLDDEEEPGDPLNVCSEDSKISLMDNSLKLWRF